MLCDREDDWQTGMCDIFSVPRYVYTLAFPCFVTRDIMRTVFVAPEAQTSWFESFVSCLGCGACTLMLAEAANSNVTFADDTCALYAGVWCCTIPLAYLIRTTVCERLDKHESCCSSLLLATLWWPCMLTQTERELQYDD